ncbi:unnamed protein product [Effrenium voratum]|uniref:Uncharacterized protein n=1 Tax=Effrenium voratum TaxID=2562239 RepID=A0AA36JNZ6_9DINO|nr:unnamed protein product [Effrenium voratum]
MAKEISRGAAASSTSVLHLANSRSLQLDPFDLIFCEAVDAELLGEGFLGTAMDACERLLKPTGQLIPCGATVYGQLICCPALQAFFSCDGFQLRGECILRRDGALCDFLDKMEHRILSEPVELLRVCFDEVEQMRELQGSTRLARLLALEEATAHCIVVWWDLHLDKLGNSISSRPGRLENHWPQAIWPLWHDEENRLGRRVAAGEQVPVQVKVVEDRIDVSEVREGTEKGAQDPSQELKVSSEEMQWLNDTLLWKSLEAHCRGGFDRVLDGSKLLPAGLVVASRTMDGQPLMACAARGSSIRWLEACGLQAHGLDCAPSDVVHSALSLPACSKASSLALLVPDVVQRSGEARPQTLAEIVAAHELCAAMGKTLTVLPRALRLTLTCIESPALASRSRVLRPVDVGGGRSIDVSGLNMLAPSTFDSISQAKLEQKQLAPPQAVLELALSSELVETLKGLNGRRLRLGPVTCAGQLHGVLCEWSWLLPELEQRLSFEKAGAIWPQDVPGAVRVGDFVMVRLRADFAQGVRVVPLQIQRPA